MKKKNIKILIILVILLLIASAVYGWFLRYAKGDAVVLGDIAFYILEVGTTTNAVTLDETIKPSGTYIHTITVSNFDEVHISQVDMEYAIKIKTTTNLPLKYTLKDSENNTIELREEIKRENENDVGSMYYKYMLSDINDKLICKDADGNENRQTNNYKLEIEFPTSYDGNAIGVEYSDTIELIEVTIDAWQSNSNSISSTN